MNVRTAALCLVVTFVVGVAGAHAQGPPADGPGAAASLAARIAALEARSAEFEERVAALETIDESDIVGSYKWTMLGIELNRGYPGDGPPARVNSEMGDLVITLNLDHTVQISGGTLRCTLPILTYGVATCEPLEEEPVTLTWSFANGVLTISGNPDGPMEFAMPANGVIVFGGSSEFQPGHSWANIGLLVKMAH